MQSSFAYDPKFLQWFLNIIKKEKDSETIKNFLYFLENDIESLSYSAANNLNDTYQIAATQLGLKDHMWQLNFENFEVAQLFLMDLRFTFWESRSSETKIY